MSEDTHTVNMIGPVRFQFELTDEELAALESADYPWEAALPREVEWEPVGGGDDWDMTVVERDSE